MNIRAFTLIETVIVIALASIMLVAISFLIGNFYRSTSQEQGVGQATRAASAAIRDMETLIGSAAAVVQNQTISGTMYSTATTTAVVAIPSIDSSGNVISNTYDYAVFYLSGSTLYRILAPNASSARKGSTKMLAANVTALTFTYDSTDYTLITTVTTDLQTQTTIRGTVITAHQKEKIYLRNN